MRLENGHDDQEHQWMYRVRGMCQNFLALHPFLIVLPRYFEAGTQPWDAFWIITASA